MNKIKNYDLIVYIGRFQPFHNAHKEIVNKAQSLAKHVLVLIGSARSARSPKNPFTFRERKDMISKSVAIRNLHIDAIRDYRYDENKWIEEVGKVITKMAETVNAKTVAIIGHDKDESSSYLNYFPQWDYISTDAYPDTSATIDATKIRTLLFGRDFHFTRGVVPIPVADFLNKFLQTEEFERLRREFQHNMEYKKIWSAAPYPPTFVTVDAIVIQSGHILLIKRGVNPGYGNWAMPGGFLNPDETIKRAAIRELREETKLKVPEKVLYGSIIASDVFDDPDRSDRGRTITHAFLFKLDDTADLPKVKGSDDALEAKWIPLSEFDTMEPVMNEDHWHIVKHMLGKV